jgi:hypothetical protein
MSQLNRQPVYKLESSYFDRTSLSTKLQSCVNIINAMTECKIKAEACQIFTYFTKSAVSVQDLLDEKDITKRLIESLRYLMKQYIIEKYTITADNYVASWKNMILPKCKFLLNAGYVYRDSGSPEFWGINPNDYETNMVPSDDVFVAAFAICDEFSFSRKYIIMN